MATKKKFTDLDPLDQDKVTANRTNPALDAALMSAASAGDNDGVAEVTRQYNEWRGLPGADSDPADDEA